MPEMDGLAKAFCTSPPYRAFARRVLVPWGLQGARLTGEVLEIGSGSGAMAAELLSTFPDLRFFATDYDPDMVRAAQHALAPFGQRANVQRADATKLPFDDGRFNAVLSFAMLHHVGDWEAALGEAARVLRPGGRLIGYDLRTLRHGELESAFDRLPVLKVTTRRSFGGMLVRFAADRAA